MKTNAKTERNKKEEKVATASTHTFQSTAKVFPIPSPSNVTFMDCIVFRSIFSSNLTLFDTFYL